MKKFIMLSAVMAAVSTAFVACSSDDDLAQQPKAPETTVEEGTPLVVKVVDATRGTDWTTNTLPDFALFSTKSGAEVRDLTGEVFTNNGSGVFAPASTVYWQDGTWDFYAISDNTTNTTEDLGSSTRSITYTVPTDYASQTDLLVGAAIGKKQSDGDVEIPFYHALARIEKIRVNFNQLNKDNKLSSNSTKYFLIKSITLKNVYTTGKFTFPATWAAPDGSSWTNLATPGNYTIVFKDFVKDDNGNIKVFNEIPDPTNSNPSQNIPTGHATTTVRATADYGSGLVNEPNFFKPGDDRHELPITDEGLYLLPQALSTTVTGSGPYTLGGPYAEIEGFLFIDNVDWDTVEEYIGYAQGGDDDFWSYAATAADQTAIEAGTGGISSWNGKANNYGFTHEVMPKYYCPISTTLLPNKRYVLNIDLSSVLRAATGGDLIFQGATIKTE